MNASKQWLVIAILFVLAAVIFAGALVWHDMVGKNSVSLAPQPQTPDAEAAFPHYAAGNINGTIQTIAGDTLALAVIPPGATSTPTNPTMVTVVVDSDTQIYRFGATKDPQTYNAEVAAYLAARAKNPADLNAPDPLIHDAVSLSQLTPGMTLNVLPKIETVQGTTLHAQDITVQ